MEKAKTLYRLTIIFRKELDNNALILTNESSAADVEGWDSLTNILIVNEIESYFNIKFKLKELIGISNIGGLIDSISSKMKIEEH